MDMLEAIPGSVIARDLGMNYTRISKLMKDPPRFVCEDIFRFAALLEIDEGFS
jgi:hypothetical protein